MSPDLEHPLSRLRRDGPRRFARWDDALFDAAAAGPAHALAERLQGQPDAGPVLAAYLELLQQAVGTGALRQAQAGNGWSGFLERGLVELVPSLLPEVKAGRRLPLLVKLWNLGEGLLREPPWLDRYITACAGRLRDLADLEGFFVRTLEPVLAPAPPATWSGPFTVTVLDLRKLSDDFLPGTMALVAPRLLRIEDRRRAGVQAAVLLRSGGRSEVLGLTEGLGDYAEAIVPAVAFEDGRLTLAGQTVEVLGLRCCHAHAVARCGFVAACAVDSQRLWIVDGP